MRLLNCLFRPRWAAVALLAACLLPACAPAVGGASTASAAPATAVPEPTATAFARPATPVFGSFDPARVTSLSLAEYPEVPVISATARAIYAAGVARGSNPRVFSKLGDCMTENPYFLVTFAEGAYDLGAYADLKTVLDYYQGVPARSGDWSQDSFATKGLAAASGFNIAGPQDPTWADPKWCNSGESPAACEFRVARPSVALLMFGTNDVAFTEPATYDFFLRSLIEQSIDSGVLPILSTFPTRPEEPEKSLLFNQIVVRAALDYDVPLINLNRALEPLPNHGVNPADTIHLSVPPDGRVDRFTAEDLQYGFTVRNLLTLQALQALLAAVNAG
ncbi:MAG: SGNH/GDSL hydrolase family protein [Anaerolineales bacterium]